MSPILKMIKTCRSQDTRYFDMVEDCLKKAMQKRKVTAKASLPLGKSKSKGKGKGRGVSNTPKKARVSYAPAIIETPALFSIESDAEKEELSETVDQETLKPQEKIAVLMQHITAQGSSVEEVYRISESALKSINLRASIGTHKEELCAMLKETQRPTQLIQVQEEENAAEEFENREEEEEELEGGMFEEEDEFTMRKWKIKLSPKSMKSWRRLDQRLCEGVRKIFLRLAEDGPYAGGSVSRTLVLPRETAGLTLLEATVDPGVRIIWQLAVDFNEEDSSPLRSVYEEVVRVWDIVKHDNITRCVRMICNSYRQGSSGNIRSQLVAIAHPGDNHPRQYCTRNSLQSEAPVNATDLCVFPPAAFDGQGYTIEKFYDVSESMCARIRVQAKSTEKEADEVENGEESKEDTFFCISEKEYQVVNGDLDTSIVLLGRSGTGKTTCALFKMWNVFRAYWSQTKLGAAREAGRRGSSVPEHLHQVFVTANPLLRAEVEKTFTRMKRANLKGKAGQRLIGVDNIPPTLEHHINVSAFSRQWILMIDGTLSSPFFPRNEDGTLLFSEFEYREEEIKERGIS